MRVMCCALVCLVACIVTGIAQAGPLDTLAAGLTYAQPMDDSKGGFAALTVTMQPLIVEEPDALTLATAPEYVLSKLTLDLLIEGEAITLGVSLPLETIATSLAESIPVRLGITYAHDTWCWYISGDLMRKEF